MIDLDTALARLMSAVAPLPAEDVALSDAVGRVLAADVVARIDSPRARVSTMDGYAVRGADIDSGLRDFALVGRAYPGAPHDDVPVAPGATVRIFTGAALPAPADRVVIQEQAVETDGRVAFSVTASDPAYCRETASDFAVGATVVPAGTRLHAGALVAAAAADVAHVTVARQPRVAMLATGDELVPPGDAASLAHAVPDSLSAALAAIVIASGGRLAGQARGADQLDALRATAAALTADADVLVVTGGASVGERDFARAMVDADAVDMLFSKVAIKPGKPVWLGRVGTCWVVGLPGNPTSALVTARLFLVPLLAALQGQIAPSPLRWRRMPLAMPLPPTGDRETLVRARWDDAGLVILSNQDSGAQGPLVRADWLVRCPAGQGALGAGSMVLATPL